MQVYQKHACTVLENTTINRPVRRTTTKQAGVVNIVNMPVCVIP